LKNDITDSELTVNMLNALQKSAAAICIPHKTSRIKLMTVFNHSTQRETLDYLCIQPEEIKNIYLNELL